jgi:hypothetical protein
LSFFFQIGRFLTFAALFGMFELHWVGLQSVAWVQMISSDLEQLDEARSEEADIMAILVENLSGKKPCDLCRAIMKEMAAEHEEQRDAGSNRRLELVPMDARICAIFPPESIRLPALSSDLRALSWRARPVSPPPQAV